MPNSPKLSPVNLNRELIKRFEYVYPMTKRTFIERSLTLALQDKTFFEKVFFNPLFTEVN